MKTTVFVAILLTLIAADPSLSVEKEALEQLSTARSLKCQFGEGSAAEWVNGKARIKGVSYWTEPEKSVVHYDSINFKAKTARIIAEGGASDAAAYVDGVGVTIIERPAFGGIVITTVFASYASPTRFPAVMSKHVDVLGPLPQMYFGTCEVWE